jgi:hypothetical protein
MTIPTQIRPEALIRSLLPIFTYLYAKIWSHGEEKNKVSWLALAARLNIELWHWPQASWFGLNNYSKTWESTIKLQWKCFVITKPQDILPRILYSIREPNTSKWIVTSYGKNSSQSDWNTVCKKRGPTCGCVH